jgi:GT2 family glycosyltransferase
MSSSITPPIDAVPRVSVIIPVYNQVKLLDQCLASLQRQTEVHTEVIVVDDASPEDPSPVVARYPEVRFIRCPQNVGYAEANNCGLRVATGHYLLLLNSDTELAPDAVARMADYLDTHAGTAGIAPLHREPDGTPQRTCFRFPTLLTGWIWDSALHRRRPNHPEVRSFLLADWDHLSERYVEHAQTSGLFIRREVYDRLGGMDPQLRLFSNDTDFCFRMHREGYSVRFLPEIEITHHGSASVATFDRAESQVYGDRYRYYRKWFGWRGGLAVRSALWSRVAYEALGELVDGQWRSAVRKLKRGAKLNQSFGSRSSKAWLT